MGDPTTDLLEYRAFPRIAQALRDRKETIIRHWEREIRVLLPATADDLSATQLRDHLPLLIDRMAGALSSVMPRHASQLARDSQAHGEQRAAQNYDMRSVLTEYRLFRRVVFEEVHLGVEGRLTEEEVIALNQALDVALHEGLAVFVEHQGERLRHAAEAEAKYFAFLSHDLRNNLNAAMLGLDLLAVRLRPRPEFADDVEDLEAVRRTITETMGGMLRLLQAERLRKAPAPARREPVALAEVAGDVARQVSGQAGGREGGPEVTLDVPDDAVVDSDRQLIALVLQNLLGNAVKYGRDRPVRIDARRRDEAAGGGWTISVIDCGPGIPPERRRQLFDAFARGATHGQEGIGLGLSIASQAAAQLGGKLSLDSEVGAGAAFRLEIPAAPPPEHPGAPRAPYV